MIIGRWTPHQSVLVTTEACCPHSQMEESLLKEAVLVFRGKGLARKELLFSSMFPREAAAAAAAQLRTVLSRKDVTALAWTSGCADRRLP